MGSKLIYSVMSVDYYRVLAWFLNNINRGINSLPPRRCRCNLKLVILKLISKIDSISCKIALRWIPQDVSDDKSILVQVMSWCCQATSHYSSQCWLLTSRMLPYGVTRPHWISLTLNVREPSDLGLSWSISWLLMPWLLPSPGHQQPWYWLWRIGRSLSYLRKDFNCLSHIIVEEWHEMCSIWEI